MCQKSDSVRCHSSEAVQSILRLKTHHFSLVAVLEAPWICYNTAPTLALHVSATTSGFLYQIFMRGYQSHHQLSPQSTFSYSQFCCSFPLQVFESQSFCIITCVLCQCIPLRASSGIHWPYLLWYNPISNERLGKCWCEGKSKNHEDKVSHDGMKLPPPPIVWNSTTKSSDGPRVV